nr:MAG TPA: hypothetical protein [Bacteriophage sp.]
MLLTQPGREAMSPVLFHLPEKMRLKKMGRLCVWHSTTPSYPPFYFSIFYNLLIIKRLTLSLLQ